MSTLHQGTSMSASIWHLAWTAIVLLPLTASAATEDAIAGPHPADDSQVAQPEVWLCAGDRIMELLQPGAEWPFVQQHLTGIKLYIGQLHGKRRETKEQTSVDWLTRVRRYEDFAREQNLTFNLIVNSERGGQESDERFFRETLQMVDTYLRAGGRPTRWFVQSWYPHPKQMLPETAPPSLTALVKAVIERVRGETLSREMPEKSAALGGGVTSPQEQSFLRRHLQPDDETQTLAQYQALTLAGAKTADPLSPPPPPVTVATEPKRVPDSPATQAERAKWDRADQFRSQTGPAGTEWDAPYRALIQTNENAVSKGLPSHAEAARLIQDDAGRSAESLATHLGWVLYIKHFSQAYRPEEATANLKRLYAALVTMQSGNVSRPAIRPFDGDARLTIHRDVVFPRSGGRVSPHGCRYAGARCVLGRPGSLTRPRPAKHRTNSSTRPICSPCCRAFIG